MGRKQYIESRQSDAHRQRGASMAGTLVLLLFGAAVLTVVIKIIPIYIDSWTIREAAERVMEADDIGRQGDREIVSRLQSQLNINGIRDFDSKNIVIKRDRGQLSLTLDYEVRTHIVKNIDAVLSFNNQFETSLGRD